MDFQVTLPEIVGASAFAVVAVWLLSKLRAGDTGADTSLIGKTGDVVGTIDRGAPGKIRIEGREWVARSGSRIEAGSFGEVVAIDKSGVTVVQVPALSSHTTGYHMMEM